MEIAPQACRFSDPKFSLVPHLSSLILLSLFIILTSGKCSFVCNFEIYCNWSDRKRKKKEVEACVVSPLPCHFPFHFPNTPPFSFSRSLNLTTAMSLLCYLTMCWRSFWHQFKSFVLTIVFLHNRSVCPGRT